MLSIQLDSPDGQLSAFLECRRSILQCIIYLTLNNFFQMTFANEGYIPIEINTRPKSVITSASLAQFKNELLILLNNISIKGFG